MKAKITKENRHLFTKTKADQNESPPAQRLGIQAGEFKLDTLTSTDGPWHETPEEVAEGLRKGAEHAEQLAMVQLVMGKVLSKEERVTMELRFVHGLSYRAIGRIMERNASTILRRVERSLKKLRRHLDVE